MGRPVKDTDPKPDVSGLTALFGGSHEGGHFLQKVFETFQSRRNDVTDQQRASAYIYFLLGCGLFVDKTQTKVSTSYLTLCHDLERVPTLAWGAACLAHLYRELGKASRSGTKQMGGCATLFEVINICMGLHWMDY